VTTTIDEVSVLREHLERYRGVTLQTLEFAPEDKLEWRPSDKAMTVAEQFLHIARVEEFYSRGFFGGVWQFELLSQTPDKLTKASLKERLDTGRAYLLEQLGRLEAKRLEEIVKEHEIHHKGQLAVYLRQFGVVPPFFAQAFPPGVRPDIR
jgi:uncharacterized damage-inducible protein DinB